MKGIVKLPSMVVSIGMIADASLFHFFHDKLTADDPDDLHGLPFRYVGAGGGLGEVRHILASNVQAHFSATALSDAGLDDPFLPYRRCGLYQ
jgi:hypothetical protein